MLRFPAKPGPEKAKTINTKEGKDAKEAKKTKALRAANLLAPASQAGRLAQRALRVLRVLPFLPFLRVEPTLGDRTLMGSPPAIGERQSACRMLDTHSVGRAPQMSSFAYPAAPSD
ncbi:MAG TPA: hypothetical protein VFE13_11845 [Caulobacteraceae bacterium]|jgi:hypothetical protein|nr:hypothetical protein [Caulobacteraceae bacterium]